RLSSATARSFAMSVTPLHATTPPPPAGNGATPASAPLDADQALRILDRRFDAFDTAAEGGEPDGRVSREDLQAVADHGTDPELVRAAEYLLSHPELRDALDVAGEGGDHDGLISRKDLTSHVVRTQPEGMPLLD